MIRWLASKMAETLGSICVNGNPDGKDTQTLVDDAVAGITAPVTQ